MIDADVAVYGATSAGVCAAVAAARAGARVLLLEPGRHVGGMTSGGLGYTDVGDPRALGGMAAQFRAAVAEHYGVPVGRYAGPEPHVAEEIFLRWLDRAGVTVVMHAPLVGVETHDGRIRTAAFGDGTRAAAAVFVDASYEGDLLAASGVSYAIGRESRALHGEQFAGRREVVPGRHAMPPWISPFRDDPAGLREGELLPQIKPAPMAEVGHGDGGVMSFGYRVCLSRAADRIPFRRRDGYDDARWELGRRIFADAERRGDVHPAGRYVGLEPNLPGGKADGNSLGPFSLSVLDGSAWEYPDADALRREQIRRHHLHHAEDFLWFLANDPAVPAEVRRGMQEWGLPADEFADTGHLPHQLYVREARRMVSHVVLTEHELRAGAVPRDVVALGSYHLDIREVQRTWRWVHEHPQPIAMVVNEGYLSVPVPVYGIGYSALVPRRDECSNLVAAVCILASHVAFSSVRMEPQYQMLGHAAGLAAAAAARRRQAVQDVDVDDLQSALRDQGGVLSL
ncbi:FAD-dependent oxidoreductase [Microbacterium yannicii]|uniref:FAD-dependent oxidoreductase n=1 Tax=Microbacterium yannicii TaxID=671622 RepID=UPI0002D9A111|nr:FAD-dependent oxidoreductase [Microbacterium yannicii]